MRVSAGPVYFVKFHSFEYAGRVVRKRGVQSSAVMASYMLKRMGAQRLGIFRDRDCWRSPDESSKTVARASIDPTRKLVDGSCCRFLQQALNFLDVLAVVFNVTPCEAI